MTSIPGQSGNPAGRAVGSRNKQTLAAEAALFGGGLASAAVQREAERHCKQQ
jgi:hypothetical protein